MVAVVDSWVLELVVCVLFSPFSLRFCEDPTQKPSRPQNHSTSSPSCFRRVTVIDQKMHSNQLLLEEPIRMASILEPSKGVSFNLSNLFVSFLLLMKFYVDLCLGDFGVCMSDLDFGE